MWPIRGLRYVHLGVVQDAIPPHLRHNFSGAGANNVIELRLNVVVPRRWVILLTFARCMRSALPNHFGPREVNCAT